MGNVIQPADEIEGVPYHSQRAHPEAGCDSDPILFPDLDGDAILHFLKDNAQGSLTTRARHLVSSNLYDAAVLIPQ